MLCRKRDNEIAVISDKGIGTERPAGAEPVGKVMGNQRTRDHHYIIPSHRRVVTDTSGRFVSTIDSNQSLLACALPNMAALRANLLGAPCWEI
jgi:hypothetical protein